MTNELYIGSGPSRNLFSPTGLLLELHFKTARKFYGTVIKSKTENGNVRFNRLLQNPDFKLFKKVQMRGAQGP